MFVNKSFKRAVLFPKNRLIWFVKDMQKHHITVRHLKTFAKESPIFSVLRQTSPKSKQANNMCSWCQYNHSQFITQTFRNSRNHISVWNYMKNNAMSISSLNQLHKSVQVIRYHKRGYATQTDMKTKAPIPVSKSMQQRRVGRKKQTNVVQEDFHHMNVMSYSVGDELNLTAVRNEILAGGVYDIVDLPRDIIEGIMVTAKYKVNDQPREAFFFRDGGVALWHMSESERHDLWKLARSVSINPYDHHSIVEESDSLPVIYDSITKLKGNILQLKKQHEDDEFDEELVLQKYTISNALSQSVSLSMNESKLEKFITQLEPETQKLRCGNKSMWKKKDINMRLGELFTLRHEINLESGYLDHPDIYWEREELEGLYKETISYFSIPQRIKVINERLNYCSEILQLLGQQLNDQHHIRLEWIIIILILIEVIFECIHYAEKLGYIETGYQYVDTSEKQNTIDYQNGVSGSSSQQKIK